MEFDILPGEAFYGGAVMDGINQPYTQASERELDLTRNRNRFVERSTRKSLDLCRFSRVRKRKNL